MARGTTRIVRSVLIGVTALALASSCGREPVEVAGTGRGVVRLEGFGVRAHATGGVGDSIVAVRVVVYRINSQAAVGSPDRRTAIRTVSFDPARIPGFEGDSGSISLTVDFPLQGDNARYEVEAAALNPAGLVLYAAGPMSFTAQDVAREGGASVTTQAVYVGPGANATRIVASPRLLTLSAGQTSQLTAQAYDASNAPIAQAVLDWESLNADIVQVLSREQGIVQAQSKRGTGRVRVHVQSNAAYDTVTVNVALGASAIQLVSGGNQSATVGTLLSNPVVVRVVASDGVSVPGVSVQFSVASGSASPASATSDASGLAQTRWTLGGQAGTQTLTVTATGVAGTLPVQATATTVAQVLSVSFVTLSPSAITPGGSSTITVLVVNQTGQPVQGETVSFSSTGTGNTFTPVSATSGSNGQATTVFSSSVAETKTISARLASNGATASHSLTVSTNNSGAVATLVKVSGDNQTVHIGQAFPQPVVVRAVSASGAPVAGAFLDFATQDGTARVVTASDGTASVQYTLSAAAVPGTGTIPVWVTGNTGITVSFTYTAVP